MPTLVVDDDVITWTCGSIRRVGGGRSRRVSVSQCSAAFSADWTRSPDRHL